LDTRNWTFETLKAYLDQRFSDQEKAFNSAFTAAEKAVSAALAAAEKAVAAALAAAEKAREAAETNSEKWRANANEWRSAMVDREQKFAPKEWVESEFRALRTAVANLDKIQNTNTGKGLGTRELWAFIVGAIFLAIAVYAALKPGGH